MPDLSMETLAIQAGDSSHLIQTLQSNVDNEDDEGNTFITNIIGNTDEYEAKHNSSLPKIAMRSQQRNQEPSFAEIVITADQKLKGRD